MRGERIDEEKKRWKEALERWRGGRSERGRNRQTERKREGKKDGWVDGGLNRDG